MAEQLTDERLKELGQAIQDFFDGAKFGDQERVMLWIREQIGPKAFTPDDVLSLVREVQTHRQAQQRHPPRAPTHQEVLGEAYYWLSQEMANKDTTRAEGWARVIATLRQDPAAPNVRVSGAGAKADITVNPGAPSTSKKPGLKQETLGTDPLGLDPNERSDVREYLKQKAESVAASPPPQTADEIVKEARGLLYGISRHTGVGEAFKAWALRLVDAIDDLPPDPAAPLPHTVPGPMRVTTQEQAVDVLGATAGGGAWDAVSRRLTDAPGRVNITTRIHDAGRPGQGDPGCPVARSEPGAVSDREEDAYQRAKLRETQPVEPKTDGGPKPGIRDDLDTVKESLGSLYGLGTKRASASGTSVQHAAERALERIADGISRLQAVAQAVNDVLCETLGAWPRLYEAVSALNGVK